MTAKPHHIEGGPPRPSRHLLSDVILWPTYTPLARLVIVGEELGRVQMARLYYYLQGQTGDWSLRMTEKGSIEMKAPQA